MNPIRIAPQKAYEEAQKFQQKIAAGMQVLRTLDDVHYGATEKEEVYREDKLVLYRFKGPHKPTAKVPILISYALVMGPLAWWLAIPKGMGLNGVLISIIVTSFLAAGFLLMRLRMLDWRDRKAALGAA